MYAQDSVLWRSQCVHLMRCEYAEITQMMKRVGAPIMKGTELDAAIDAHVSWNLQIFLVHRTRVHTRSSHPCQEVKHKSLFL